MRSAASSSSATPGQGPAIVLESGSKLCTVFDILRQVEFVHTPACASGATLLDWAKARANHLGLHVPGRVIQAEVEGLSSSQVVVHSAVHPRYIVTPWRLPFARHEVCTVPVDQAASAYQAVSQLESDCGLHKAQRFLVAKRIAEVRVNHQSVGDPFLSDAFLGVDTAALVSAEARLRRSVPKCVWHLSSGGPEADTHIMVHRHGSAPIILPCPGMLPPADLARYLCRMWSW